MEEEKKIEEKVDETQKKENDSSAQASKKENCKCGVDCNCKEKISAIWSKDKKKIIIAIVVLVVIAAIAGGAFAFKSYWKKVDIGKDAVKSKMELFIKNNATEGAKVDIKEVTKEGDLYKIMVSANGQEVPLYMTRDGKKLIQQPMDLDEQLNSKNENVKETAKTEAEQKTDIPTVDLFVMSYCPYGLQMERGIIPVVETLKDKIKFNLKFVDYTLHGQKEVDENLNQYCISKVQPEKLAAYLKCFWKKSTGTAAVCMKSVGINAIQIKSCLDETKKQFNPAEKSMGVNKDETEKFGVQGSPTLVINGTTISSGRDSASILKAICSGFTTQPKECATKLSDVSPVAGFDDQASAAAKAAPAVQGAECGQ